MPKSDSIKTQAVHLDERGNPEGRVLVTAQDEDRFVLPCAQAVEACKMHISRKVWFDELDAMLVSVRDWAAVHTDAVSSVYAAPREGHVVIFVVPRSDQYDLKLGAILTELDIELAREFRVIAAEVMQVPGKSPELLATFVSPDSAKTIHE